MTPHLPGCSLNMIPLRDLPGPPYLKEHAYNTPFPAFWLPLVSFMAYTIDIFISVYLFLVFPPLD